jgi:nickel-dependent lactate racemase
VATTTITLPLTDQTSLAIGIDELYLGEVIRPALVTPVTEVPSAIAHALDEPLDSLPLMERVRPGQRVLILTDDNTRPTPTAKILPLVLERLHRAGVHVQDIEILIAAGTHRPMTDAEIVTKLGARIVAQYRVARHEAHNPAVLYHAGLSPQDIPIWLNRKLLEADFILGIGNVVPHPHVGWSGGAKILYPGVAGAETVAAFHRVGIEDPTNYLGRDGAPARLALEALATTSNLHFVINTVLTSDHQLYKVFGGDPRPAQQAAQQASREVYGVPARERYDIVVSNSYPAFLEFWQAGKGIFSADLIVNPGGAIILLAPCPEGVGITHPRQVDYLSLPLAELQRRIAAGEVDDPIAAAVCVKVGHIACRTKVAVVSPGLQEADVCKMGFLYFEDIHQAMNAMLEEYGRPRIAFITHGGETIPYVE